MKSNELRIGNLVNIEATTHIIKGIQSDFVLSDWLKDNEPNGAYINVYEEVLPIVLTEERLIKFGLLKTRNSSFLLGCYELVYSKGFDCWNVILRQGTISKIKYVHQLQNLYFALTGEELTTS